MLFANLQKKCQIYIKSSKLKIEKKLKVKMLKMSEKFYKVINHCNST